MPQPDQIDETAPRPKKQAPPELAETQRVPAPEAPPPAETAPIRRRPRRGRWLLLAFALAVLVASSGAFAGWQLAVGARQDEYLRQSAVEANFQFQLGVTDLQNGNCARAKERFIYVIELLPQYPGVQEQLIQASLCQGGTAVPDGLGSADAPAEPTPTPDTRGTDLVFSDAQNNLAAQNWDALLPLLDTLRKNFPDHQPIEVDRMYYIALRNRGLARLQSGDLERGIFDLNRAEQIGPLDNEVTNWRQWAVQYILGLSFWEIDWVRAFSEFQTLAVAAPSIFDSSGISAQERLAQASTFYADHLIDVEAFDLAADKQWCSAEAKMYEANALAPLSEEDQATANFYTEKCALNGDEPR